MTRMTFEEETEVNINQLKTRSIILLLYIIFSAIPLTPILTIASRQDDVYLWLLGFIIGICLSIPALFILYRLLKSLIAVIVDKTIN